MRCDCIRLSTDVSEKLDNRQSRWWNRAGPQCGDGRHVDIFGLLVTDSANFEDQLDSRRWSVETLGRLAGRVDAMGDQPRDQRRQRLPDGAPKGLRAVVKEMLDQCVEKRAENPAYREAIAARSFIFAPLDARETEPLRLRNKTP